MQLDHIAINVQNVRKAAKWYTENLGASIRYIDDTWASLSLGDTILALTLPKQHPPHIAVSVKRFSDFPEGHEIKYHRDGSAYLYIEDIDGNTIEYIYWPGGRR